MTKTLSRMKPLKSDEGRILTDLKLKNEADQSGGVGVVFLVC